MDGNERITPSEYFARYLHRMTFDLVRVLHRSFWHMAAEVDGVINIGIPLNLDLTSRDKIERQNSERTVKMDDA